MTDQEEFVEKHWERAELCEKPSRHAYSVSLGGKSFTRACVPEREVEWPERAWKAAAEFTRERLEEVRQLDREIVVIGNARDCAVRDSMNCIGGNCCTLSKGLEGSFAACAQTFGRAAHRLQLERNLLVRGMRFHGEHR